MNFEKNNVLLQNGVSNMDNIQMTNIMPEEMIIKNMATYSQNTHASADIDLMRSEVASVKEQVQFMQKSLDKVSDISEIKKMQRDLLKAFSSNSVNSPADCVAYNHNSNGLTTKNVQMIGEGIFEDPIVLTDYQDSFPLKHAYNHIIDNDGIGMAYISGDSLQYANNALIPGLDIINANQPNAMNAIKVETADAHVRLVLHARLHKALINKDHDSTQWIQQILKNRFGEQIDAAFFYYADDIHTNRKYRENAGVQSIFTGISNQSNNIIEIKYDDFQKRYIHCLHQMLTKIWHSNSKPDQLTWVMSPKMHSAIQQIQDQNNNFIFQGNDLFGYPVQKHYLLSATDIKKTEDIILADFKQCYVYFEQEGLTCKLGNNPHSRDTEYYVHKSCAGTILNKSLIQYCKVADVPSDKISLKISVE
jgi:hypothetical protein